MTPSFLGLIISGFLNLIAIILIIVNFNVITSAMFVQFVLLLAISIGIHSVLHFQQEVHFGFNPLEGKWKPREQNE